MTRPTRAVLATVVLAAAGVVGACTGPGGPILANPTASPATPPPPTAMPTPADDPMPVVLPRDDGPHDRLTEWWYYTGHLHGTAPDGTSREFGFEYVIFRAERGDFPTSWASHVAITDETDERFVYGQRLEIGPQADRSPRDAAGLPTGFDLALTGIDPTDPTTYDQGAWTMAGAGGTDRLGVTVAGEEAAAAGATFGLALELEAVKPPALHDRDGYIDFGSAGGSYYYSRTAMTADGTVELDGVAYVIDRGTAWFDHQWGDFISVGGGGWDWFAINLEDGVDLTFSLVRDADGSYPLVYGTLVEPDGATRHLGRDAFTIEVTDRWVSPSTGADYPAGWTISLPGEDLVIELTPTVADQELDTRATTGVVYWEGSQVVRATRAGRALGGDAYVELTGYAPSMDAPATDGGASPAP